METSTDFAKYTTIEDILNGGYGKANIRVLGTLDRIDKQNRLISLNSNGNSSTTFLGFPCSRQCRNIPRLTPQNVRCNWAMEVPREGLYQYTIRVHQTTPIQRSNHQS